MSSSINTNIAAFYAQANITAATQASTSSVARLSSGNAIVQASDNVAALAVGSSLATQVSQLTTAQGNATQGGSLLQVADGALAQIQSILQQQESLALQAESGALTDTDRGFLNQQFAQLTDEIDSLASGTTFNGVNLIDGSIATGGSNNPLTNNSIDPTGAAVITYAGFSNSTGSPASGTVNFSGFTDTSVSTTVGQTNYSGFTFNATAFTATTINPPSNGGNDPNLNGSLAVGGIVNTHTTTLTIGLNGAIGSTATSYAISYTINNVLYSGNLLMNANTGSVAAGTTVQLTGAGGAADGIITLTVGNALAAADHSHAGDGLVKTDIAFDFASATGVNGAFGAAPTITQPAGSQDPNLYGSLGSGGAFNVVANGTGIAGNATGYTVTYTINGTTYTGTLANDGTGGHGVVAAGHTVTLTATTSPATHATIVLTVANAFGSVATGSTQGNAYNQSANILAALNANFASATGVAGGFGSPSPDLTISSSTLATHTPYVQDAALYGDLSKGVVSVSPFNSGTFGASGTATSYSISYTLNGVTYTGALDNGTTANTPIAGSGRVASGSTVALVAANHATINLAVNEAFGTAGTQYADQSANIQSALQAYLTNATGLSADSSATITGQTTVAGLSSATAVNDIGKNDTALVGALNTGVFQVANSGSGGYSVSYAINGSTYQGSLTGTQIAASGSHDLVLDNGSGSIVISVAGNNGGITPNTSTASASAFQAALTTQFAGATAYAVHSVATTLATDSNGNTIAGSAITATATAGTLLNTFTGANVQMQSALFDTSHLPPVADFTGTGSGTSTVLSVLVDGVTYSTVGAVTGGTTVAGSTFNGVTTDLTGATVSTGLVTFYANGNASSNEKLQLNLSGIGNNALITTTADVTNLTNALNSVFGSGGSSGGLTFQLGSTSSANVTVNIASAKSSALFGGASLNISTAGGASTAATAVATAINTVTSIRAGVGALESQFNFASAALQSSVQNEDAAKSSLLDTNIATESTNYATEQVKLQAGISVLAQANQQVQALLKLIG